MTTHIFSIAFCFLILLECLFILGFRQISILVSLTTNCFLNFLIPPPDFFSQMSFIHRFPSHFLCHLMKFVMICHMTSEIPYICPRGLLRQLIKLFCSLKKPPMSTRGIIALTFPMENLTARLGLQSMLGGFSFAYNFCTILTQRAISMPYKENVFGASSSHS